MSEQGWREFLTSEGVADWVVLHGGAAAVFVVPSMTAAVRLAEAVAGVPGLEVAGPLLTVSDRRPSEAHSAWILSDPAGNRVCIAAWPDGASREPRSPSADEAPRA